MKKKWNFFITKLTNIKDKFKLAKNQYYYQYPFTKILIKKIEIINKFQKQNKYQSNYLIKNTNTNSNSSIKSKKIPLTPISIKEKLIKKSLQEKYFIQKIKINKHNQPSNFPIAFHFLLRKKLLHFFIILIILYYLIFRARIFRNKLSIIFNRYTSEPNSPLFEIWYESKLNIYVSQIVSNVVNDHEVQLAAKKYLNELFQNEVFINELSKWTNHLIIIILSNRNLLEKLYENTIRIFDNPRLEKETKNYFDLITSNPYFITYVINLISYFFDRKETHEFFNDLIDNFVKELRKKETMDKIAYMFIDAFQQYLIADRDKFIHFLDDYPKEENFKDLIELMKKDDYIIDSNFLSGENCIPENFKFSCKNSDIRFEEIYPNYDINYFDKIKDINFESSKDKFNYLYGSNNIYHDGYLSPQNPRKYCHKIISLGYCFENEVFSNKKFNKNDEANNFLGDSDLKFYDWNLNIYLQGKKYLDSIYQKDNFYLKKFIYMNELEKTKEITDKLENYYKNSNSISNSISNANEDERKYFLDYDMEYNEPYQKFIFENFEYKENFHLKKRNNIFYNPEENKKNIYDDYFKSKSLLNNSTKNNLIDSEKIKNLLNKDTSNENRNLNISSKIEDKNIKIIKDMLLNI
jgi:hypothetical protein